MMNPEKTDPLILVVEDEPKLAQLMIDYLEAVSYTHLTLPTIHGSCRSRWSAYH